MTSPQLAYQRRQRAKGLCIICPSRALMRGIFNPDTGEIIAERVMTFCERHYRLNRDRTRARGGR